MQTNSLWLGSEIKLNIKLFLEKFVMWLFYYQLFQEQNFDLLIFERFENYLFEEENNLFLGQEEDVRVFRQ